MLAVLGGLALCGSTPTWAQTTNAEEAARRSPEHTRCRTDVADISPTNASSADADWRHG